MATFFRVIALILKYGPSIWELVMEILDLINGVSEYLPSSEAIIFKAEKKKALAAAVASYKKTKSVAALEALDGELTVQLSNFQHR